MSVGHNRGEHAFLQVRAAPATLPRALTWADPWANPVRPIQATGPESAVHDSPDMRRAHDERVELRGETVRGGGDAE